MGLFVIEESYIRKGSLLTYFDEVVIFKLNFADGKALQRGHARHEIDGDQGRVAFIAIGQQLSETGK